MSVVYSERKPDYMFYVDRFAIYIYDIILCVCISPCIWLSEI